jgi:hypothetical protein
MKNLLAAKIALENELIAPVHRLVTQYVRIWERSHGRMQAWERLQCLGLLEQILLRHYARVSLVCTGQRPPRNPKLEDATQSLRHMESLRDRAKQQARLILAGVDKDLGLAMVAYEGFVDDGTKDDEVEIETKAGVKERLKITVGYVGRIKAAAQSALSRWRSRAGTTANVNTNAVAEEAAMEWAQRVVGNAKLMKRWVSLMDGRERATHHEAHNRYNSEPIPVSEAFEVGGSRMMAPGDTSLGASMNEICNCFIGTTTVSGDVTGATAYLYQGDVVEITTRGGNKLSGTPNHPVLTSKGWVALGKLRKGGDVVSRSSSGNGDLNGLLLVCDVLCAQHVEHIEPSIKEVFDTLAGGSPVVRVSRLAVDFHGDRPGQDIDVVRADGVLMAGGAPPLAKHLDEIQLASTLTLKGRLTPSSFPLKFETGRGAATTSYIGRQGQTFAVGGTRFGHSDNHRGASITRRDPRIKQVATNDATLDAKFASKSVFRDAVAVFLDEIVKVDRVRHDGPVYNLETVQGWYYANGVVVHNCRCAAALLKVEDDGTTTELDRQTHTPAKTGRRVDKMKIRDGDIVPELKPTSTVTFNGGSRGQIVLSNHQVASFRQHKPDTIIVTIGDKTIARATVANGRVSKLSVSRGYQDRGIAEMLNRSVAESFARNPRAFSPK